MRSREDIAPSKSPALMASPAKENVFSKLAGSLNIVSKAFSYALLTLSAVPSLTPCAIKLLKIEKLIISATENKNIKPPRVIYFIQSAKIS